MNPQVEAASFPSSRNQSLSFRFETASTPPNYFTPSVPSFPPSFPSFLTCPVASRRWPSSRSRRGSPSEGAPSRRTSRGTRHCPRVRWCARTCRRWVRPRASSRSCPGCGRRSRSCGRSCGLRREGEMKGFGSVTRLSRCADLASCQVVGLRNHLFI